MSDGRGWVRESAAESLAKIGDRSVPMLESVLQSRDRDLRQLAEFTLRRIGTIRAQTALRYRGRKRIP